MTIPLPLALSCPLPLALSCPQESETFGNWEVIKVWSRQVASPVGKFYNLMRALKDVVEPLVIVLVCKTCSGAMITSSCIAGGSTNGVTCSPNFFFNMETWNTVNGGICRQLELISNLSHSNYHLVGSIKLGRKLKICPFPSILPLSVCCFILFWTKDKFSFRVAMSCCSVTTDLPQTQQ